MIITIIASLLILVSLFRAASSSNALTWVREFNRIILGLLVAGFSVMQEWGMLAIVLDAAMVLLMFFVLRTIVSAQGEEHE